MPLTITWIGCELSGPPPNTVQAYARDLGHFQDFLKRPMKPRAVSEEHVSSWLVQREAEGTTARTQARQLSALRGFYKYLVSEEFTETIPLCALNYPSNADTYPRPSPWTKWNDYSPLPMFLLR